MARPKAIIPVAQQGYIKWMLYGEPGVGKSKLIGSGKRTLILANNPDETVSMRDSDAVMWVTNDMMEATEAYEYLRHEGHKEFDWVWLDNGTLFQEQNMDRIMADLVAAKPHRDQFVPDMAQYLQNQNQMGLLIRNMVALPMNVGMTGHVMYYQDDEAEETIMMPLFQGGQGAFSQKVCGYMNLVTYMGTRRRKEGTDRYLVTEKAQKIYAKDRFGVLPRRIMNPTVPEIQALIEGGGESTVKRRPAAKKATPRKKVT